MNSEIADNFQHGENLQIGFFNVIEENVKVGNNVTIKNFVELRKGTVFGDRCFIDSRVSTSGGLNCKIGNNVTLRYSAIIARNVVIKDDVFISPQVGFINIPFKGKKTNKPTVIEKGVLIGFNATIREGITIAEGVIVGAKANVTKDLLQAGVYVGNPARLLQVPNVTKGKNVIIEKGACVGGQPYLFHEGKLVIAKAGVVLGNNVWIGQNTVILQGQTRATRIGNNVKIAQFSNVGHDSILEDGVMLSAGVMVGGFAKIGKKTLVGMNATIRNRVNVGAGCFIGMNACITKDIPDNVIAYGNPCKVIRPRKETLVYLASRYLT